MTAPKPEREPEIAAAVAGLSQNAIRTIKDGDDHEWYGSSDRAADQLEYAGLVRRPFSHDRRCCVPNRLGLAVRAALLADGDGR